MGKNGDAAFGVSYSAVSPERRVSVQVLGQLVAAKTEDWVVNNSAR